MNTCSLTVKYALMGSTCEMDVRMEVGPTRLPI